MASRHSACSLLWYPCGFERILVEGDRAVLLAAACRRSALLPGLFAVFGLLLGSAAQATTITLSDLSSDATPASLLDATFDFSISGASELTLTVTNDTSPPNKFNINEIFFNGAGNVAGLSLDSATHSVEGLVTGQWGPVDVATMVNGFGVFDFGLTDGVGEKDVSVIGFGESVDFVFTISGTGPFDMNDFVVANASGNIAAAKFVSGKQDDSAFGAAVPEPATGALVAFGLVLLGVRRRQA